MDSSPALSRARKAIVPRLAGALLILGGVWPVAPAAAGGGPAPAPAAPLVRILTPHDGQALNAATLRVRALVAAVTSAPGEHFTFDGAPAAGRNAGRIQHVSLALDGHALETVDTSGDGPQVVAGFRVDLTSLTPGLHHLAVTAIGERFWLETTVQATFILDPGLPFAERNRIEEAATPEPLQGFVVHVRGWNDHSEAFEESDNDDDRGDQPLPLSPGPFKLSGRIAPGHLTDGLNLTSDRVVVTLGSEVVVFEPGELTCRGRVCRSPGRRGFLDTIELQNRPDGQWRFRIGGPSAGSNPDMLFLRIGNDWGGFDARTGGRIARLQEKLDVTRQTQQLIGPEGGTIQTTGAMGVVIRLAIPAGALGHATPITMTPLSASPLAGPRSAIHPGVKFEPEGLQFAKPATLTFDFSATAIGMTAAHSTFLLTSPTTMLPLKTVSDPAAKTLTTTLHHFSVPQPGPGNQAFLDLKAWADPILQSTGPLTLSELEMLLAFTAAQQKAGCAQNCIDLAVVAHRVSDAIAAIVSTQCSADVSSPTDQALSRYLQLEVLGQQFGADTSAIRPCLENILGALILRAGSAAFLDPSDTNLSRLASLAATAQGLGFGAWATHALQELDNAMRERARRLMSTANAARGTANQSAVFSQVRTDLGFLVIYVSGPGAAALQVDPGLPAYLQSLIASLTSTSLKSDYAGTYQDFYDSGPVLVIGPPDLATMEVVAQNGNDVDLLVQLFVGNGSVWAKLFIHATVTAGALQGQVTGGSLCNVSSCRGTNYYDGRPVAWTINPDGSIHGIIVEDFHSVYYLPDDTKDPPDAYFRNRYWKFDLR